MRGVQYGTLYKLLGRTVIDGCNNTIVLESVNEENNVPDVSGGEAMLWHQRLGHIGEKGLQSLQGKGMVEGMSKCNSDFNSVIIVYMENIIELNSLLELQGQK